MAVREGPIAVVFLLVSCIMVLAMAADNMCVNEGSGSGLQSSGSGLEAIPDGSGECLELNDHQKLLHSGCTRYMANRCYLLHSNSTSDYGLINRTLDAFMDSISSVLLRSENKLTRWCGDVLFALACNSVYLSCDPETTLPMGLCKETCLHYLALSNCSEFFTDVIHAMNEDKDHSSLRISLNCSTKSVLSTDANEFYFVGDLSVNCYQGPITGMDINFDVSMEDKAALSLPLSVYILPSASAVIGSVIIVSVVVLSGCYIRRLRKRGSRVGVARQHSYAHTDAFHHITNTEVYTNSYTLPLVAEGTPLQSSGDVSHDIEQPTTQPVTTRPNESGTETSTDVFQLDLADWKAVGEGVLVPFEHITITGQLGEGAFGYVVKGLLNDIQANGEEYRVPVAMKTLKKCASYEEMRGLLLESALMHSFSHAHILSLRGICLDPNTSCPYLIMPFMEHGDLRKFLRRKADSTDSSASVTTYPQGINHGLLVRMCCDVAEGMEYLAEKRLVHRDLAARNCMVDRNLRVKVADFGLTREIYQQDCYRQTSHGQLPIKWMSPESLAYRISNEKTDVWSYGVTCWEVFSMGKVPYPTIDNCDLLDYLEYGRRLSKPRLCNQHVYDIMQLCWILEPNERPAFSEIVRLLSSTSTGKTQLQSPAMLSREASFKTTEDEYVEMNLRVNDKEVLASSCCDGKTVDLMTSKPDVLAPVVIKLEHTSLANAQSNALVLTNSTATIQSPNEAIEGSSSQSFSKLTNTLRDTCTVQEGSDKDSLLHSIIQHLREKADGDKSIDGPLLAKKLENCCEANCHNHHPPAAVKTVAEVAIDPDDELSYIYEECPTTPNVTISFKTGEKVTPLDTLSSKTTQKGKKSTKELLLNHEASRSENNNGKKRVSIASVPENRAVNGGQRTRFLSYTVGDYVRMNPAPHS